MVTTRMKPKKLLPDAKPDQRESDRDTIIRGLADFISGRARIVTEKSGAYAHETTYTFTFERD